jgi:hypothetical protein
MNIVEIENSQIGILLIDAQPIFWDYAFPDTAPQKEAVMVRMEHLLMLSGWMDLPVIATFEHPVSENGELPDRLEAVFPAKGQRYTKKTFNCTSEPEIKAAIKGLAVKQIAVSGAETDVCIMQSVLGLLQMDYHVFLLEDCLFTTEHHPAPVLRRMYQAGAIPCTLKSLSYELVKSVTKTPWYPPVWDDENRTNTRPFPEKFVAPEEWPSWEPKL